MALIYSSDGKLVSPDGGNTWMTPSQAQAKGYTVDTSQVQTTTATAQPQATGGIRVDPAKYGFHTISGSNGLFGGNMAQMQAEWDNLTPIYSGNEVVGWTGTPKTSSIGSKASTPSSVPSSATGASVTSGGVSGNIQVTKGGTTMTIDPANLSTWTSAGWTQVGGVTAPQASNTQTGGNIILQSPSGQLVSVSTNDPLYQQYISSGFKPPTQTQTAPPVAPQSPELLQKAYDAIDNNPNIPDAMKQVAKDIITQYGGSADADFQAIMDTFQKVKSSTIDPYYASQIGFLQKNYQQSFDSLKAQRQQELEQQATTAGENIRGEQANLEAAGLTTTGEGVRQLGGASAFGGTGIEGLIPQSNRLMASSSQQRYLDNLNKLGQNVESDLGSSTAGMISGYTPSGGLKGTLQEQENKQLGQTLTDIAQSQAAKNALNRSVNINL